MMKGGMAPPLCVDALDNTGPLLIALLHCLWPSSTLRACDNSSCGYNAHYKARLVKVVGVFV